MHKILVKKSNVRAQPHYLYDLSLPLPERRHKRLYFTSQVAAAVFLGVQPERISVSRATKHRIWSEAQGKWFAVRLANEKSDHHE